MSTTQSQLKTVFYDILREEESDSSAYPSSFATLLLNASMLSICSGQVIHPITKEVVTKGQLSFLNTQIYYTNSNIISISLEVSSGDTVINVSDTSSYPSTGAIFIMGNVITYTSKTSTAFIGCSNVVAGYDVGTSISIAFALPSDYMSPINVIVNNTYKLEPQLYDDIYQNLMSKKGSELQTNSINNNPFNGAWGDRFYTIKDGSYLILYNTNNVGDKIQLRYQKTPTQMVSGTDICIIPNDILAQCTIPYLAVGEILYNRGEEQRGSELISFAISKIKELYSFYNKQSFEEISNKPYKMQKSGLNI